MSLASDSVTSLWIHDVEQCIARNEASDILQE
jgi:hypothetical protein